MNNSPYASRPLRPGTRVRHHSQQWPEAFQRGTATIVKIIRQWPDGSYVYDVETDDGEIKSWGAVYPVVEHEES